MNRKYNKGLNIKMTTSVRKDKKKHIQKVEHKETKNVLPSNNDKFPNRNDGYFIFNFVSVRFTLGFFLIRVV